MLAAEPMCRSEGNSRKVVLSFRHVVTGTEFRPAEFVKRTCWTTAIYSRGWPCSSAPPVPSPKRWDRALPCFHTVLGIKPRTAYTRQALGRRGPCQAAAACYLNDCHSNWGETEFWSNFTGEGCKAFPHTCWLFALRHLRALPLLLSPLIDRIACFPGI